jgi:sulfur carrier protein
MEIRLNGKTERLAGAVTVGDLIREKGLDPNTIVVEHNLAIIATEDLEQITLKDNDSLEILRFVGGG